jgi:outer membrane lipoprotein carrier protein
MTVLLFLLMAMPANPASAESVKAAVRALESRYSGAHTLKAIFYERYRDGEKGGEAESGTVYFSKPGRMRWEYESPEQKLFLVDGQNVWFYLPGDHTASRAKLRESSDWRTPLALLVGKAELSKLCRDIQLVDPTSEHAVESREQPAQPGNTILRCIPRPGYDTGGSIREVLLETDSQAYLVHVVIRETGGTETEFRFGNWQANLPIPEAKFHFDPPPGVAIVDEDALAGTIH